MGDGILSPRVRRPQRKADNSASAGFKSEGIYIFIRTYKFIVFEATNFTTSKR